MIAVKDSVLDELIEHFPDRSRVWIYQSTRPFTNAEAEEINAVLQKFNESWESHGRPVDSASVLLMDRFVVFVVDDTNNKAGGCSIDTSVHLMKEFEQKYNVEMFNRLQIVGINPKGDFIQFDFKNCPELLASGTLNQESTVFNNTIHDLASLRDSWMIPLKDSFLKRYL